MGVMIKEFIDRFANMEKIANETLAAQPGALVGVDSMPGSEHDAKVPAEAKKPDAEVTQGQPAGATTAEGAVNGGDTKPLNEGKLEVNQPLENPDKKPLISDDALSAKEASAKIDKLANELLDLMKTQKQASAGTQDGQAQTQAATQDGTQAGQEAQTKEAQCGGGSKPAAKPAAKPATAAATPAKKEDGKDGKGEEKKAGQTLELNEETLSKIAAATATFMAGRDAAEKLIAKQASDKAQAIALIKEACVKAAQEAGLDPAAAAAAADNAMTAAGLDAGAAEAAAADAGAAATDAGAADAGAAGAGEGAASDVQIPEDVTEEELGSAIVDLVQNGQLDADTAKALVDELAGDAGADAGADAGITEDQAAEIIANGLENGEITPEQAKEIVNAIESGSADAGAAAADAGAAGADAAAASEAAGQAAADAGAADAEAAMKQAADDVRKNAINKVASAILAKRDQVKQAEAQKAAAAQTQDKTQVAKMDSPLMNKVAEILIKRKEALDAKANEAQKQVEAQKQASAQPTKTLDDMYIQGFCKKAADMGVDPQALAKYVCANKAKFAQAK